jgi:hypothetical protein
MATQKSSNGRWFALQEALHVPMGRDPRRHEAVVYANFADRFRSWDHFDECLQRVKAGGKQVYQYESAGVLDHANLAQTLNEGSESDD